MSSCAITAYKALNGVFCVYKLSKLGPHTLMSMIRKSLARDLNHMEVRPTSSRVVIDGAISKGENLTVKTMINYADHPLVVGPRYQMKDIKLFKVNSLDWFSSGVIPIGVGSTGCYLASKLRYSNPIRCYELTGRLGTATETFDTSGSIREKSTYGHVTRNRLDAFLAKMEGNHQTSMYLAAEIDIKTQQAYEIASKGLLKPKGSKTMPVIYSIKCLEFNPPYFTVEVQCVNEWPVYLKRMIHDIGVELKTSATCARIRCTRYGRYTVDDCLLPFHVNVENVLNVMEYSDPKQRKLVRPAINTNLMDDLDVEYDEDPSDDQEEENLRDLESMTFKFEKDADGWTDNGSHLAANRT